MKRLALGLVVVLSLGILAGCGSSDSGAAGMNAAPAAGSNATVGGAAPIQTPATE